MKMNWYQFEQNEIAVNLGNMIDLTFENPEEICTIILICIKNCAMAYV
jgi:hypothetical protein